jgi:hypothetical protein
MIYEILSPFRAGPDLWNGWRGCNASLTIAPIEAVENWVFVGHDDPFEAVTRIYLEPQGVAYFLWGEQVGEMTVLERILPDAGAEF